MPSHWAFRIQNNWPICGSPHKQLVHFLVAGPPHNVTTAFARATAEPKINKSNVFDTKRFIIEMLV
jgi:hypothetical protein